MGVGELYDYLFEGKLILHLLRGLGDDFWTNELVHE